MNIATLRDAITASNLPHVSTITEFLPAYEELTLTFAEGLTVRIASHGNGTYQATLDGFLHWEPLTAHALIARLQAI